MNLTREEVLDKVREVGQVCLPSPYDCDRLLEEMATIGVVRPCGRFYRLRVGRLKAWCVECRLSGRVRQGGELFEPGGLSNQVLLTLREARYWSIHG